MIEFLVFVAMVGSFVAVIASAVGGSGYRGLYLGGAVLMTVVAFGCLSMPSGLPQEATEAERRGAEVLDTYGPYIGFWMIATALALLVGGLMFKPAARAVSPATRPCPFCAEKIQAAALVCRFCNRDVPASVTHDPSPAAGPTIASKVAVIAWVVVGFVGFVAIIAVFTQAARPQPDLAGAESVSLQITARRTQDGYQVTNQEDSAIGRCVLGLVDDAGRRWSALMFETIEPNEMTAITWQRFASEGQQITSASGMAIAELQVNCGAKERIIRFLR